MAIGEVLEQEEIKPIPLEGRTKNLQLWDGHVYHFKYDGERFNRYECSNHLADECQAQLYFLKSTNSWSLRGTHEDDRLSEPEIAFLIEKVFLNILGVIQGRNGWGERVLSG